MTELSSYAKAYETKVVIDTYISLKNDNEF